VNALTGVSAPTLRKWEAVFRDYLSVVRTEGGQRRFHPEAVEKVETLKQLIYEEGLSLEGARRRLERLDEGETEAGTLNDPTIEKLSEMVTDLLVKKLFQKGLGPPGLDPGSTDEET
jgi:DNA-binding transcriptional MerR regulator